MKTHALSFPFISIRFHFVQVIAEGGNRSGQKIPPYKTPKEVDDLRAIFKHLHNQFILKLRRASLIVAKLR